jgi:Type II secretion system (T2SS), protein G
MLRRETFSMWPAVVALAMVTLVVAVLAPRVFCRLDPSKRDIAERIVTDGAETRFPAWRASHRGCPRFAGELLDEPVDPWGRPYRVVCVATPPRVVITSAGEDGRLGTLDDISASADAH